MFEGIDEVRQYRKKFNYKMYKSGSSTFKEFDELEEKTLQSNALDQKVKELVALGISITSHCYGCIEYHATQAVAFGATHKEIAETVAVALVMGGGPAQWPGRYVFQVLDELDAQEKKA